MPVSVPRHRRLCSVAAWNTPPRRRCPVRLSSARRRIIATAAEPKVSVARLSR